MNILECWPTEKELTFPSDQALWENLIDRRIKTTMAFFELEKHKGLIIPGTHIHTSKGQEMVRLLMFRVLEESAESVLSTSVEHLREEAIDAFNYLLSIMILDQQTFPKSRLIEVMINLVKMVNESESSPWGEPLTPSDLGQFTLLFGGHLADTLRNRSWMNNAQDPYFSGVNALLETLIKVGGRLLTVFPVFGMFVEYYVAKDNVLQFRIKSNY